MSNEPVSETPPCQCPVRAELEAKLRRAESLLGKRYVSYSFGPSKQPKFHDFVDDCLTVTLRPYESIEFWEHGPSATFAVMYERLAMQSLLDGLSYTPQFRYCYKNEAGWLEKTPGCTIFGLQFRVVDFGVGPLGVAFVRVEIRQVP